MKEPAMPHSEAVAQHERLEHANGWSRRAFVAASTAVVASSAIGPLSTSFAQAWAAPAPPASEFSAFDAFRSMTFG
jgi:hypothetical protein